MSLRSLTFRLWEGGRMTSGRFLDSGLTGVLGTLICEKTNIVRAFVQQRNQSHVSMENSRTSTTDYTKKDLFKSRETSQLWRSLLIPKASSLDPFVTHSDRIFLLGRKLLWQPMFDSIMLKTFYGQFAAGVSIDKCASTVG